MPMESPTGPKHAEPHDAGPESRRRTCSIRAALPETLPPQRPERPRDFVTDGSVAARVMNSRVTGSLIWRDQSGLCIIAEWERA